MHNLCILQSCKHKYENSGGSKCKRLNEEREESINQSKNPEKFYHPDGGDGVRKVLKLPQLFLFSYWSNLATKWYDWMV